MSPDICEECINTSVCSKHGRTDNYRPSHSATKSPGTAAVLSFLFVGLGQIYNGQIGKGLGLMVLQVFNFFLIFVGIGIITYPLVWILVIVDAYQTAERINEEAAR